MWSPWKHSLRRFLSNGTGPVLFLIHLTGAPVTDESGKNNIEDIVYFLETIIKKNHSEHLVVLCNLSLPASLSNISLPLANLSNFFSKEDYEYIDDTVFKTLSCSWYRYPRIPDYHGISLGQLAEYDFQKFLIPRIKNLDLLKRITGQKSISRIVVIEDSDELVEVARHFSASIKVPFWGVSLSRRYVTRFFTEIREKISDFLCSLYDRGALNRLLGNAPAEAHEWVAHAWGALDMRLYPFFQKKGGRFILIPLEKGVGIRRRLRKLKNNYFPLYLGGERKYMKEWRPYREVWKKLIQDEAFKKKFTYKGLSLWPWVQEELSAYFLKSFPRMISNIRLIEDFFHDTPIKTIVLRNDHKEFEKTLTLVSRSLRISSVVIQHGILAEKNGHGLLLADRFLGWGNASREWYEKNGNARDGIMITGNLKFDELPHWKPTLTKEDLCRRLNLDCHKKIVLFVTQQINKFSSFWSDDLFYVKAQKILDAMKKCHDKALIIKADPYENLSPYQRIIQKSGVTDPGNNFAAAIKSIPIYDVVFHSDVVITLDSTVALEAMVFEKPVITFNLTKREDRVPYGESGAALAVYDSKDLPKALEDALYDERVRTNLREAQQRFVAQYAYQLDGKAHERIFQWMTHYDVKP